MFGKREYLEDLINSEMRKVKFANFKIKYNDNNLILYLSLYANLSMGYHKIELYDIRIANYNLDIRQYFMEIRKKFLDDCKRLKLKSYKIR